MAPINYPPFRPSNLGRTIKANVPQKFLRDIKNRLLYGTAAPLSDEVLFVAPADITRVYVPDPARNAPVFQRRHSGLVRDGDWDLSMQPLTESLKYQACKAHWVDGVPWHQTGIFEKHLRAIAEKGVADECHSREELEARYARLDRMFDEVSRSGRLLRGSETEAYFRREHGGIFVHIDRNGLPLRRGGGEHRFAVARILNLPEIPVQPGVIHKQAFDDGHLTRLRRSIYDGDSLSST